LVTDSDGGQRTLAAGVDVHNVEPVARFCTANVSCINRVVAELLLGQLMLRVADLTVSGDSTWVEFDLHLYIGCGDMQRTSKLIRKSTRRLLRSVDKAIPAIPVSGQHFKQVIVIPFPTDAEAIERDALFAIGFHLLLERLGIDTSQIGGTVRKEHHAIDTICQVMA